MTKLLAFYLPQFHRIPENDRWWGEGFTEWTNVKSARPLYPGHLQPRRPANDDYYDLSDPAVHERQCRMAGEAGIHGFCYYYYHFDKGRRLLEMPLERMLESGRPDYPFCLCWANESWSRRWDGDEHKILIKQCYSREMLEEVGRSLGRHFQDPRYIRSNGKCLFIVYRARAIPDCKNVFGEWRRLWAEEYGVDVLLLGALTRGEQNPTDLGLDGSAGFPPHNLYVSTINDSIEGLPDSFKGSIHDYHDTVKDLILSLPRDHAHLPCVTLGWDNAARTGQRALIFERYHPMLFLGWLKACEHYVANRNAEEQRYIIINAWNEWAEGAYLEPDVATGDLHLELVRDFVNSVSLRDSQETFQNLARKGSIPRGSLMDTLPYTTHLAEQLEELARRLTAPAGDTITRLELELHRCRTELKRDRRVRQLLSRSRLRKLRYVLTGRL